jgi:hypothetical protein
MIESIIKKDDDNIYDHSQEFTTVQIAQLLSGKYEGYPLHLFLITLIKYKLLVKQLIMKLLIFPLIKREKYQ